MVLIFLTEHRFTSTLTSTKEAVISTPYLDPATGLVVITVAQTIHKHRYGITVNNTAPRHSKLARRSFKSVI